VEICIFGGQQVGICTVYQEASRWASVLYIRRPTGGHLYIRRPTGGHLYIRRQTGGDLYIWRPTGGHLYIRRPTGGHLYIRGSNGKSLIVEERLYSFFFAFFPKKNEASFFSFSSSTQLLMKPFVLLRSCKIVKSFTSFCFVFTNFWNTPIRFTIDFEKVGLIPLASLCCKILEQPGLFCFDLQKFKDKQFVSFSILQYFGLILFRFVSI
jgi:hypothetical protein